MNTMFYKANVTQNEMNTADKIAHICIDIALRDYEEIRHDILASFTKDISDTDRSVLSRFKDYDIVDYVCASAFLSNPYKDDSAAVRYRIKLEEAIVSVTCDIMKDDSHYTIKRLRELAGENLYREGRECGKESRKGMRRLKKLLS